jgi:hypothetical protein
MTLNIILSLVNDERKLSRFSYVEIFRFDVLFGSKKLVSGTINYCGSIPTSCKSQASINIEQDIPN